MVTAAHRTTCPTSVSRGAARASATVALALAAALAACGGKPEIAQLPPPEVAVAELVVRDVVDSFESTGRTTAVESVDVRARVAGYLVKLAFQDGDMVEPGAVLFEIDPRPFEAQKLQAEGELARWEAQRTKAEADLARNRRLLPTGAASQKEFDSAVAAKATADAEILSARGRLAQANLNLEFSRVTAPVRGRVSKANVTLGNLVDVSTLLTTIVSVEPMYVYFDIDERTMLLYRKDYRRTHPGQGEARSVRDLAVPVEIGLATDQGYPRRGTLDFADNQVNPDTGTMLARALFANTDRALTPGLFVRVRLPVGDPQRSLLVNERAIGTDQGTKYVLVVGKDHVVEYRPVTLGPLTEGMRAIRSGVAAGEKVVVDGLQRVRPGVTVNPHALDATPGSAAADAGAAAGDAKAAAAPDGH